MPKTSWCVDVGQHFILGHTFIMKHPHMFMRKGVSRLIEPCEGSGIISLLEKIIVANTLKATINQNTTMSTSVCAMFVALKDKDF